MSKRDYYEVLGVEPAGDRGRTQEGPTARWLWSITPIRNPDNPAAEEKFKEAAEAYEVLNDPQRRARYDRFGHAGMGQGGFGGGGMTMDDIFSNFGDILWARLTL